MSTVARLFVVSKVKEQDLNKSPRWAPPMSNGYEETFGVMPANADGVRAQAADRQIHNTQRSTPKVERWEERPVAIGRVPGEEVVSLELAAGRVLAQDVASHLHVHN